MTMAAVLRSCRRPGRLALRPRLTRSVSIATDSGITPNELQPPPIQPHSRSSDRRKAIKGAKPFSEFLTDNFNRQHDYLRISVTERCNLRCLYCMPEEGVPLSPPAHLLTTPEIFYLSSLFVSQGVTKIRLTGGEPTVRADILPLMQQIGSLRAKGLQELALTTNGISLHRKLDKMVEAGLTGVNISLDTLDPFQFQILTRRKGYDAVMKSIDRVLAMNKQGAGVKLKVNCVVMRGINERELIPFVEMGREKDIEVRFIEYMPFGGNKWSERKMLTYQEMLEIIREKYPSLRSVKGHVNDTSKTFEIPGFVGKIGFITSMTHNFCGTCNRLRITSDGNLKVCLHGNAEVSLRDLIRKDNNGDPIDQEAFEAIKELEMHRHQGLLASDKRPSWNEREAELLNVIGGAVKRKKEKHAGMGELENMENRPMILIAEGNNRARPQSFKDRTRLSGPWSTIPIHLLHPHSQGPVGARTYSTSSNEDSRQRGSSAPTDVTAESGFQSLRGLFGRIRDRATSSKLPSRNKNPGFKADERSQDQIDAPDSAARHDGPIQSNKSRRQSHLRQEETWDLFEEESEAARRALRSMDERRRLVRDSDVSDLEPTNDYTLLDSTPRQTHSPAYAKKVVKYRPLDHSEANRPALAQRDPLPPSEVAGQSGPSLIRKIGRPARPIFFEQRAAEEDEAAKPTHTLGPTRPAVDHIVPRDEPEGRYVSFSSTSAGEQQLGSQSLANNSAASPVLTHLTSTGEARMVDVGHKPATKRVAVAYGFVRFTNDAAYRLIAQNANKKGDVLGVARIAGIMAAKRCSDIIPLCHPISITKVQVDVELHSKGDKDVLWGRTKCPYGAVTVEAQVHCHGNTGVEMEALTAVSAACLTVYDMCKAVDQSMTIEKTRLMYKSGGKKTYMQKRWGQLRGMDVEGASEEDV